MRMGYYDDRVLYEGDRIIKSEINKEQNYNSKYKIYFALLKAYLNFAFFKNLSISFFASVGP